MVNADVHFTTLGGNKAVLHCIFLAVIVDKAIVRIDIVVVVGAKLTLHNIEH